MYNYLARKANQLIYVHGTRIVFNYLVLQCVSTVLYLVSVIYMYSCFSKEFEFVLTEVYKTFRFMPYTTIHCIDIEYTEMKLVSSVD